MSKTNYLKAILSLVALFALLPTAAWSQASRPPLPPAGPSPSYLDLANRLRDVALEDTDVLATLELSLTSAGDLWSVFRKSSPQGLFVTLDVEGKPVKGLSKGSKPKVVELIGPGMVNVQARFVRPGRRVMEKCKAEMRVGFQQVVFLPYGGAEGYFSCQVIPRLLPNDVFQAWASALTGEKAQAYNACAAANKRGTPEFWPCVDAAGIELPKMPV